MRYKDSMIKVTNPLTFYQHSLPYFHESLLHIYGSSSKWLLSCHNLRYKDCINVYTKWSRSDGCKQNFMRVTIKVIFLFRWCSNKIIANELIDQYSLWSSGYFPRSNEYRGNENCLWGGEERFLWGDKPLLRGKEYSHSGRESCHCCNNKCVKGCGHLKDIEFIWMGLQFASERFL